MFCPDCRETELVTRARLGCSSSPCPRCGGVWLSRSDLQRLGERTGLFLKARGREGMDRAGLKRPLWKELFDVEG